MLLRYHGNLSNITIIEKACLLINTYNGGIQYCRYMYIVKCSFSGVLCTKACFSLVYHFCNMNYVCVKFSLTSVHFELGHSESKRIARIRPMH